MSSLVQEFPSFEKWITDMQIQAPKVQVLGKSNNSNDNTCRGLFAKETIHPGELILHVPARCVISERMLQNLGSKLMLHLENGTQRPTTVTDGSGRRTTHLEENALMMIERFRLFVEEQTCCESGERGDNAHSWKEDDALALFLIASKTLLLVHDDEDASVEIINDTQCSNKATGGEATVQEHDCHSLMRDVVGQNQTSTSSINTGITCLEKKTAEGIMSFLPYIGMLPDKFPTHPVFYTANELKRIEGTNCHEFTKRMIVQMKSDYDIIERVFQQYWKEDYEWISSNHLESCRKEKLRKNTGSFCHCFGLNPKVLTLDAYQWALTTIYSRASDASREFKSGDDDVDNDQEPSSYKRHRVIVPFLDMINHGFTQPPAHYSMDSEGNMRVYADTTIPSGSEILYNYGNFGNEKLLMVYGFVVDNNPFEAVQLYAPLPVTDPLYDAKSRLLLNWCDVEDPNSPYILHRPTNEIEGILPNGLLSALRLIGVASIDEIVKITTNLFDNSSENQGIPFVNNENEYNALLALGNALEIMTRQLALCLISDTGLSAASISPVTISNQEHLTANEQLARGVSNSKTCNESSTSCKENIQPGFVVSTHDGRTNTYNTKILCEGQYDIFRLALEEVTKRLEELKYI